MKARLLPRLMVVASALAFCSAGCANASDDNLPNFHQVNAKLARSSQPTYDGLKRLASQGFTTVIDLRIDADAISREQRWTKELGMKFIAVPMDEFHAPSEVATQTVVNAIKESDGPVLVHCSDGNDCTNAMVALYRIHAESWGREKAYSEMLRNGFHPMFTALSEAVRDDDSNVRPTRNNVSKEKSDRELVRLGSRLVLLPM